MSSIVSIAVNSSEQDSGPYSEQSSGQSSEQHREPYSEQYPGQSGE